MMPAKGRVVAFAIIVLVMFAAIFARMARLQLSDADVYAEQAESKSTKTITLTGMRGKILDRNMVPLAYDRRSYDVQFYRDPSRSSQADREAYTAAIVAVIDIIEGNGKSVISDFWLAKDENGNWAFSTGATTAAAAEKREKQWRENFYEANTPVEQLFDKLCQKYGVPDTLSEEQKIQVLAVWQEQRMNNFQSKPVSIAYDVGFETVSEIEARSMELDGISIAESSTRVYPQGSLAAHTVGYISRISGEEQLATYKEKGYANDAYVGATGIEASMEDQLTANIATRQGKRVVEISRNGKIVREMSYEAAVDGNTVILTLDSELQAVAESALLTNIRKTNKLQQEMMQDEGWQEDNAEVLAEYEKNGREVLLAETGALVAMDPNSGGVLALASEPGFDLSMFEGEVDRAYWNEIIANDNNPMYNRAISARDTPGSIFKLVTALAGLMEGKLTLDERITDEGFYMTTDTVNPPSCWVRKANRWTHARQTVVEGLKNSCNYFFYTVGDRLGSELITKWAAQLGLTSRTGIELNNETTSFVGNQEKLYDANRAINEQYTSKPIFAAAMMKKAFQRIGEERGIEYDDERIARVTKKILDLVVMEGTKQEWIPIIRQYLMEDMNLPSDYIQKNTLVNEFFYYIQDLRWTANETIMAAIGQSITQVTPIAVARYVSAVANGGTVYDAQIIDKIVSPDGAVVLEKSPVVANQIIGAEAYFAAIQEGMKEVTSVENDGTAASQFRNARYAIAAKTGTAERTDIDLENNSWLVTYAPADDPKIVVVVYIQNGYAGAQSASAAITVIEAYLDSLQEAESTKATRGNTLSD